jgi:DNA-binding NarL/FixJ family response regulator
VVGQWSQERRGDVLRVVIVDDEELIRSGLRMVLDTAEDIDVVAVCDGPAAVATVVSTSPDIGLLDVRMPQVDGLTVLARIRALPAPPVVAMLTSFATGDVLHAALRQGAAGYLLKDSDPEQLIRDVRALAAGLRPLASTVVPTVIDGFLAHSPSSDAVKAARLTPREMEVLALLGQGLTNAEIGTRLLVSTSTAKDYASAVITKLGVANRVQAAVLAERAGLLQPPAAAVVVRDSTTAP